MDYDARRIKNTLVPMDGSTASLDALELACILSKRSKGAVYAVYVIEVARTLPLDAEMTPDAVRADEVLKQAEDTAASLDYQVSGEILQARDRGHAIVDEAIERDLDAIIMGVKYNRELGEFTLGDTAQYVLRNAPCQVILYRSAEQG